MYRVGHLVHLLGDKKVRTAENPTALESQQNRFFIPRKYYNTVSMIFETTMKYTNNDAGTMYVIISEMHNLRQEFATTAKKESQPSVLFALLPANQTI